MWHYMTTHAICFNAHHTVLFYWNSKLAHTFLTPLVLHPWDLFMSLIPLHLSCLYCLPSSLHCLLICICVHQRNESLLNSVPRVGYCHLGSDEGLFTRGKWYYLTHLHSFNRKNRWKTNLPSRFLCLVFRRATRTQLPKTCHFCEFCSVL